RKVFFNFLSPATIDLTCRIFFLAQTLMSKHIAQSNNLGCLHYPLGKMRRNEYDTSISCQYNISWHYRCTSNSCYCIYTNQCGIQTYRTRTATYATKMM